MKLTWTRAELLEYRRRIGGLEPLRTDCSVVSTDGIDVDAILSAQLRRWYLDLLDNGPRELIAPENISATTMVSRPDPPLGDASLVRVPDICRRVFDIRLKGWSRAVEPLPASEIEQVVRRQLNPFTAATASRPVAVLLPPGSGQRVREILAWPSGPQVTTLYAAVDTGDDSYCFDEAALSTIPATDILTQI
ncbi:MAG: hypothetical protein K2J38_05280 [Muribaculaceae bacterium]|nr:hypothetical protein [Muribaculaceae bacterium]